MTRAQVGSDEGIGIVVIGIGHVVKSLFALRITPGDWTPGIEKDVVVLVKAPVGLARDHDGKFNQVVEMRIPVAFVKQAAPIMIHPNMFGVDVVDIHTQRDQIGVGKFLDAGFSDTHLVPMASGQDRRLGMNAEH